jgi:hypothetical protein
MKTAAILVALLAVAFQAQAAPIGARASQFATLSVTVDQYAYRVNTLATFTHTSQGMAVYTNPNNMFSTAQPAGPENNSDYSGYFVIPMDIIGLYY